ncbi:MAG: glycosyltransferase family 2 protein [Deltaproteobacteria bacterium]|nr:glycosyltransferase family 2 protein [Deltaproteobacteria bacterium]
MHCASSHDVELSIIMPCLNEAETLAICIDKARKFLESNHVNGEVIIADNGSTDGSQAIAKAHGATVVDVMTRGYGAAIMGGITAARGKYIIMGDADDSYDFYELKPFVSKLREGYDLVMGNRFKGGIKPGAMPFLHKYLGNPVLTGIGRLFFGSPAGDFHCGLRGFSRQSVQRLNLRTTGMEFASEMIVKMTLYGFRITEVPTTLSPDGRSRPPHLRAWRDGWRHLRFLLIYSPRWLFLYPGGVMMLLGLSAMLWLLPEPRTVGGVTFDVHTMLYASMLIMLGLQTVLFAFFAKVYGVSAGLLPEDKWTSKALKILTLERGIIFGVLLCLLGTTGSAVAMFKWSEASFGPLAPQRIMRITIPSLTMLVSGIQIIFSSFFLSILELKHK